ncbi:hypothetical protein B0A53_01427 [Rhodotorula sp. CCFEE 5036]|nr:hypothetical protein B0A53_01427 [Rhodotorula sp. CCFEE 5036]
MNSTRPLLKATTATTAKAVTRTRRRTTATAPRAKGDAAPDAALIIPPSRDLIGPPCPLSNLRPVYYAPLFPSLHSPSGWGDLAATAATDANADAAAPLPSLWTAAGGAPPQTSTPAPPLSSDPKLVRLERVRQRLHAQDLEWRWARYRFDAFNQAFWTRMNERFLRGREAYLLAAAATARADAQGIDSEGRHGGGGGTDHQQEAAQSLSSSSRPNTNPNPNPNAGVEGTPAVTVAAAAVDLAPFYAQHLAETKRAYADYNKQLWRFQAGLIWPAG